MLNSDFIVNVILVLILAFLSTFITQNLVLKIIIFSITAMVVFYGYIAIVHETSGRFSNEYGKSEPATVSILAGHRPLSVRFQVKLSAENKVIVDGLELSETLTSDDRIIDGKLLRISLLSFDKNGFTIKLINETGKFITAVWVVKYNKLNDFLKRRVIFNEK